MNEQIVVGKRVFLKPLNNRARGGRRIEEMEIIEVKRKYFELKALDSNFTKTARIDNLHEKSDYSPDFKVYFSKEEIEDEYNREDALMFIQRKIQGILVKDNPYTTEQLMRIVSILKEPTPQKDEQDV